MSLLEGAPFIPLGSKVRVDSQHASDDEEGGGDVDNEEEDGMQID